nr:hypothetical protein Iba_chr13fCG1830 [Ipomoea batatas]
MTSDNSKNLPLREIPAATDYRSWSPSPTATISSTTKALMSSLEAERRSINPVCLDATCHLLSHLVRLVQDGEEGYLRRYIHGVD